MRTLLPLLALCAGAGCHSLPDSRTAVEHEQIATVGISNSDQARAAVNMVENTRPANNGVEATADPTTPLYGTAQGRAGYESMTAEDHLKIARKIRHEAEIACARVAPSSWVTCPLPRPSAIERIPHGVRLTVGGATAVEQMRDQIDCAIARAHVERPSPADEEGCPILVPGAHTRVIDRVEGPLIEITADQEPFAVEIRGRAERLRTR